MENTNKKPIKDPKELTGVYKKSGRFDKQRRELLESFKASETHQNLLLKLKVMIETKIKNDPQILMKNKGKMAALIQGELINEHIKDRNSLLKIVDKSIREKLIDTSDFHDSVKKELRDIKRRHEGISDEEFARIIAKELASDSKLKHNKVSKAPVFKFRRDSVPRESSRDSRESREPREPRESRESRETKEAKDIHLMY